MIPIISPFSYRRIQTFTGPNIYASAIGTGSGVDADHPCSILSARAKARTVISHGGSPTIYLRDTGGNYYLTEPLTLDTRDAGGTWTAYAGEYPVISGGMVVTGWTLVTTGIYAGQNVWKATVPIGTPLSRELYVDGKRAIRARGSWRPAGWTVAQPATAPNSDIANVAYPTSVEAVGSDYWMRFFVGIASAVGTTITWRTHDWTAATAHSVAFFHLIDWLEGAQEWVINGEGYWAINPLREIYYKPRLGEVMASVEVILPVAEQLLTIDGTLNAPVTDIAFSNIVFEHTTWLEPNVTGYGELQAGIYYWDIPTSVFKKIPGAITVTTGHEVDFIDCTFKHIGSSALALEYGSQNCDIIACIFDDIGASGVTIGNVVSANNEDHHPSDIRQILSGNTVANSVFTNNSCVFSGAVPIWLAYTNACEVAYNIVEFADYSGISCGWGWGLNDTGGTGWPITGAAFGTPSCAGNNLIHHNAIRGIQLILADGGSIYVNGGQPGTLVHDNYCSNDLSHPGFIYLDNGCADMTVSANATEFGISAYGVKLQTISLPAVRNTVTGNFANTLSASGGVSPGYNVSNTVSGNIAQTSWTSAGLDVRDAAGLQSAHAALRPPNVARIQTVTVQASSYLSYPTYYPTNVIDGDLVNTIWQNAASDTSPWIQIDLGHAHNVVEVAMTFRTSDLTASLRRNFEIRGSNDFTFATYDVLLERGSTPVAYGEVVRVQIESTSYRYIRAAKTVAEDFCFCEMMVYGTPVDSSLLWMVDYSDWPTGVSYDGASAGGGLTFFRNIAIVLQTGPSTAATIPTFTAGIGQNTADATKRGLSFFGAQSQVYSNRNPQLWSLAGSGVTYTPSYTTSPIGSDTSTRIQVNSGGYSKYNAWGVSAGSTLTISFWVKGSSATPVGTYFYNNHDTVASNSITGTTTANWQRVTRTVVNAGSQVLAIPEDGRADSPSPPTAGARDVVIDFSMGETSKYMTPWAASSRPAETAIHIAQRYLHSNNRFKYEVKIVIAFASADMGAARRFWTDADDATTYVEIGTNRVVTCVVAGTSVVLPVAIPVWTLNAVIILRVDVGNGTPTGTVTIDGVTTSLGTGVGSHSALTMTRAYHLSDNLTKTLEGLIISRKAYV